MPGPCRHFVRFAVIGSLFVLLPTALRATDITDRVEHRYADNDGVKIHYATLGEGPLVVMIHGFPDFWYTWRHQMEVLAPDYRVAAVDLRGYNKSGRPKGVDAYRLSVLATDIIAVIRDLGETRATIMGHDWGGALTWHLAIHKPDAVERVVILNLPHFRGLARELANNPQQRANSQYARNFQQAGAHESLTPEDLSRWVEDEDAKARHLEAMRRSDFEAMLNLYKANYPREPYVEDSSPVIKVQCPVLLIHGLDDWALLPGGLNGTWNWLESDLTLVTIPGAGHWVHHDATELVNRSILAWLRR